MAAAANSELSSAEKRAGDCRSDDGSRGDKRSRREEQATSPSIQQNEDDDQDCSCVHSACPLRSGANSQDDIAPSANDADKTEPGSGNHVPIIAASEPSFLHGPLLSVKIFDKNPQKGQVTLAVIRDNHTAPVATLIFRPNGTITSVTVKPDFRGMGLSTVLFKELFALLASWKVTEVLLEAEEDTCKHNRLVKFYESFGFRQKEGSKVYYLHNQDQMFRKVLMSRQLPPGNLRPRRSARLVDNGSFLVVRLQTKTGGFVRSTADGDVVTPTAAPGRGGIASSAAAAVPASQPDSTAAAAGVRAEGSAYPGGGSAATVCGGGGGGGAAGMVEGGGGGGEPVASSDQRWGGGTRAGGRDTGGGGANCHWILIVHHVRGVVCFESSYGKYLCVEPDGKVVADRSWDNSWEQFRLERVPETDPDASLQQGGNFAEGNRVDRGGGTSATSNSEGGSDSNVFGTLKARDRFTLRTYHGQYLSLDAEYGTVSASAHPVLWTTDKNNGICLCEGTIPRAVAPPISRQEVARKAHMRSMRQKQDVAFVTNLREKYLGSFGSRGRFSIKEALERLDKCFDPLLMSPQKSRVSLAGIMVLTAEGIRDAGLPDWMQAIGLVHGLGRILHFLGEEAGVTPTERECVLGEYSWVVGAPFPDHIACSSYNADNADAVDQRYGAGGLKPTGMYDRASGLQDALLCFTGPEYMYMMLRNNAIDIPPEGLAMLRLYPLEPWHNKGDYSALESPADKELRASVHDFDQIRRDTLKEVSEMERHVNLEHSWNSHLGQLVDKFFPGELAW